MSVLLRLIRPGLATATLATDSTAASVAAVAGDGLGSVANVASVARAVRTPVASVASVAENGVANVAVANGLGLDSDAMHLALEVLQQLYLKQQINLRGGGYPATQARISIRDWRLAAGLDEVEVWRHLMALESDGALEREWGYVRPLSKR